jgi:hypothetical protein
LKMAGKRKSYLGTSFGSQRRLRARTASAGCAFGAQYSPSLGVAASSERGIAGVFSWPFEGRAEQGSGSNGGTLQQVQFAGAGDRLHAAVYCQFAVDMLEVYFDSGDGKIELLRDRAIGQAGG